MDCRAWTWESPHIDHVSPDYYLIVSNASESLRFAEFGHRDAAYRVVMKHAIGVVAEEDVVRLEEDDEDDVEESSGGSILTDPVYIVPLLIVILAMLYKFVYLPQQESQDL